MRSIPCPSLGLLFTLNEYSSARQLCTEMHQTRYRMQKPISCNIFGETSLLRRQGTENVPTADTAWGMWEYNPS
ncbi:uncharacterized protein ASPGLDRAFT_52515 [Aspergillus glaucus CBS 516.65]|uniref:Uncharacterized protein n=1 Tax=Aspergillus glaucus CBS 516.65 TaxID=1160497 RepID=A0A1L9V6C8_ASPGL|nr:hypothetical protein ASPGLDRAFT_52515 [Aspergillus glaucus CBS 516.65]OJJ79473.1 hypothetical protein ASPGLDRAFT_52515 [Aspergillus glaucus CBS 516.65]